MYPHLETVLRHQKDMRQQAEQRHLEREVRNGRKATQTTKTLVPAGNGYFRWSTERDRAA